MIHSWLIHPGWKYLLTPSLRVTPFTKLPTTAAAVSHEWGRGNYGNKYVFFSQTRRLKSELYKAEKRFYFSLVVTPLSAYQYLGLGVSGSRNLYYPFHSLATEHTPWHFSSFPRMATLTSLLFQTNTQLLLTPLTLTFLLLSKCSFPSWSSWLVPSAPQSHLLKDTFSRCLI